MKEKDLSLLLKKAGFRATKPRLHVLSILMQSKQPLRISEIFKKLGRSGVDRVTVYRTLQTFKEAGVVNQIDFQDDSAYFELKDTEHDHHHVVCIKCKKIDDFVGCDYKKLSAEALVQAPRFSKILTHSFEFFGLCRMCA